MSALTMVIFGLSLLVGGFTADAAQTTPERLSWAKGSLAWDWAKGTGMPVVEYRMKCGIASGQYTLVVPIKPVVPTDPPPKNIAIRTLQPSIDGLPRYCVVTAVGVDGGESPASNEFFFLAAGEAPAAPTNLRAMP